MTFVGGREILKFGSFTLDGTARVLYKGDQPVSLTPKQVDTLVVLVRNAGQVVERERLLAEVWAGVFVEDGGLTRNISAIRKALDCDNVEYIETIPKRGYRFKATMHAPGPAVSSGPSLPRWSALAAMLLVITAALAAGATYWAGRNAGGAPHVRSIGVVPFTLLSNGEQDRYLAIGLADLLATRLSGLSTVQVHPVTNTAHLAGLAATSAAGSLDVDALVTGTLRREGDRLRLTVQVLDTRSNTVLYAGSFDERGTDVLALEHALTDQVLGLVVPRVLEGERYARARRGTANEAALDQYLLGRYALLTRDPEQLDAAIQAFQQATALDSEYALAYAGLAQSFALLGGYQFRDPSTVYPAARTAALRALALDDDLPEAHAALAEVQWTYEYDWDAADASQQRAIRLAPFEPTVHQWRAYFLAAVGRVDEAMAAAEQASRLAPHDFSAAVTRAGVAYWCGRLDDAVSFSTVAASMPGHRVLPLMFKHWALFRLERFDEARATFTEARPLAPQAPLLVATEAIHHWRDGRREDARSLANALIDQREAGAFVDAMYIAAVFAHLGDLDRAFAWVTRAQTERSGTLPMIAVDPVWWPFRDDPRFRQVVADLHGHER